MPTIVMHLVILACSKTYAQNPWLKIARSTEYYTKQLSGFHYQRNMAFKFIRTEPLGNIWEMLT